MSKEDLIRYIGILSKNLMTLDGYWFLGIEERYGLDVAIELDRLAWEKYAVSEARRIKAILGINEGTLEDLRMAVQLIAFAPVSGFETAINGGRLVVRIINCRPQRARVRYGRGEFPCKPVGLAHLSTFASEINPKIKTRCICAPPDAHPEGYWCSWEFFFS